MGVRTTDSILVKEESTDMRTHRCDRERFDTVIVGAGQAGLATGYYLAAQGRDFAIVDEHARVGPAANSGNLEIFDP